MKQLSGLVLFISLLLSSSTIQALGPGPGGPVPDPTDPTAVPIDGGASLLLAGGVALGLKRLRARRRQA